MVKLDPNSAFHARVAERLTTEQHGWFVTVGNDGTPQPTVLWFLWDGADSLLIYSQDKPKIRHIAAHPQVAFHLNDADGGNVVIFTGTAVVDETHPKAIEYAPYLAKYGQSITGIGYTAEQFSDAFPHPVVVTLEKLRGH